METWKVGPRYKLLTLLGSGSYGAVCKALDVEAGNRRQGLRRPIIHFIRTHHHHVSLAAAAAAFSSSVPFRPSPPAAVCKV